MLSKGLREMGLTPCDHDQCMYTRTTPSGGTIYVGTYVDDVIYYGTDNQAKKWFETELQNKITVNFMGTVSWYLGIYYEWSRMADGRLSVHLSQEAMVHKLLNKEQLLDCNPVKTPHRSGYPIDRIPHDGVLPERKNVQVKWYQSILGGCAWLSTNSRPDISAAVSLLTSHIQDQSERHVQSAHYLLQYLKGSSN